MYIGDLLFFLFSFRTVINYDFRQNKKKQQKSNKNK